MLIVGITSNDLKINHICGYLHSRDRLIDVTKCEGKQNKFGTICEMQGRYRDAYGLNNLRTAS